MRRDYSWNTDYDHLINNNQSDQNNRNNDQKNRSQNKLDEQDQKNG